MPSASADLATTWAFLEEGVDHIMTKLQTGVSYSKVTIISSRSRRISLDLL
jgi:cullin 1